MKDKFVITIGRQMGSGGMRIAKELAWQLNIPFYDKELINIASKESGIGAGLFEEADEKKPFSIFNGYMDLNSTFVGGEGFYVNNYLDNETLFQIQSDTMRKLAEKQSCIFVGRCADYVLREHPACLNLFICADMEDRVKQIMKQDQITEDKAKKFVNKMDKKRAAYYNYYTNKAWGEASSYHLCINTSVLGIEKSASIIRDFAEKKWSK